VDRLYEEAEVAVRVLLVIRHSAGRPVGRADSLAFSRRVEQSGRWMGSFRHAAIVRMLAMGCFGESSRTPWAAFEVFVIDDEAQDPRTPGYTR